jgi:hypothetical protein
MANINTKRSRKERSKAFSATRKAGGKIVNPPAKHGSARKGVHSRRATAAG